MNNKELYHEEITTLKGFRKKIETKAMFKEDLHLFTDNYEDLLAQAKVITRVSDRLQKKLDSANIQILEQNEKIKDTNLLLEDKVYQLVRAKVGKKAGRLLLIFTLGLFGLEQIFLEPVIEKYVSVPFVDFGILTLLFFIVKSLESSLENFFLKKEKKKILDKTKID